MCFNFIQVPFWCVLGMPSNNAIIKNVHSKSIDFWGKKVCSPAGFEPATSWMQVSCTTHWAIRAMVFDGMLLEFSPLLCLQTAAECSWSLHYLAVTKNVFMVLDSYMSMSTVLGKLSWRTDRQMDSFSALLIGRHDCFIRTNDCSNRVSDCSIKVSQSFATRFGQKVLHHLWFMVLTTKYV